MAVLTFTRLETHPTSTNNLSGIINGNWEALERFAAPNTAADSPQHGLLARAAFSSAALTVITYAASVNLDVRDSNPINKLALTGDVAIAVTNSADDHARFRFLLLSTDGSARALAWPGDAVWIGATLTAMDASSEALVLVIAPDSEEANIRLIVLAYTGGVGSAPSWADTEHPCKLTTSDGDLGVEAADWNGFASPPIGRVDVLVNRRKATVGNGTMLQESYFSADGGATALTYALIPTATSWHWVGSNAGFQLATTDTVIFAYNA